MVGPHMPCPMMNIALSLPKAPSSSCQITRSIGEAPRPPYSLGQCRQAQPASAFFFCQAFATSRILAFLSWVRPSEDLRSSSSYCFGALAPIQARASARNAASCGVSSKFMVALSYFVGWVSRRRNPPCFSDCGTKLVGYAERSARCAVRRANPPYRFTSRRVLLAHAVDQLVFPVGQAAEPERQRVGAAVVHMAVEL